MNGKMLELYNRAVNESTEEMREWHTQWNHKPPLFDYEKCLYGKFAKLIIRECIENIEQFDHHINPTREIVPTIVSQVKEHFGVE